MMLFSPHITSPKGGEMFNQGQISITWDKSDPPFEDSYTEDPYLTSVVSYEIEYTENYQTDKTVWHTLKRRIPWTETSFNWVVGKMIKSDSVRIRMRSKNSLDQSLSDWSMSSGNFLINIFKLIPPVIVSPVGNQVYTDFILIILDETLTKGTFNQKVRYTLEYSSEKRNIDFTVIVKNLPVGQNVIRWNLDNLLPSDDYILRLTAKNFAVSCLQSDEPTPDQIGYRFIYNIQIQQPGMFLIDTKPPQAVLDIEDSEGATNELVHTITIFAEDDTSEVEQIQIRECDASTKLALGNTETTNFGEIIECKTIEKLLESDNVDFGKLIGKPLGYSTKTQWTLTDKSGLRKLEALLTDTGGNTSIQNISKTFIPVFRNDSLINDLIVSVEQKNNTTINQDSQGNVIVQEEVSTFEVAYLVTDDGQYWTLEPFPRLIGFAVSSRSLRKLFVYNGSVYLFTYRSTVDSGIIYIDNKSLISILFTFPNNLSQTNSVAQFSDILYIGLENGELWKYNGATVSLVTTFPSPISSIFGDNQYLYVSFYNSSLVVLYNGEEFFESDIN
mgnify:CR=1 FL=1